MNIHVSYYWGKEYTSALCYKIHSIKNRFRENTKKIIPSFQFQTQTLQKI